MPKTFFPKAFFRIEADETRKSRTTLAVLDYEL